MTGIPLSINGIAKCATGRNGDNFTGVVDGPCPTTPPIIPPTLANQLLRSDIQYSAYDAGPARRNVDLTEFVNIWGHRNATDAATPWSANNGSAAVIQQFNRRSIICAHFNTGNSAPFGFFTYPPDRLGPGRVKEECGIDIVISKIKGDFTPNGAFSRFNTLPTYQNAMSWIGPQGHSSDFAKLELNTDYFLNIRAHLQRGPNGEPLLDFPLYLVRN